MRACSSFVLCRTNSWVSLRRLWAARVAAAEAAEVAEAYVYHHSTSLTTYHVSLTLLCLPLVQNDLQGLAKQGDARSLFAIDLRQTDSVFSTCVHDRSGYEAYENYEKGQSGGGNKSGGGYGGNDDCKHHVTYHFHYRL